MKKIIRKISCFMLIALLLPMLFACGDGSGTDTTTTADGSESVTTTETDTITEATDPPTTTEKVTEAPTETPTDPAERPEPDENGIIAGFRYYLKSPNSGLFLQVDGDYKFAGFTQEVFTGNPDQMFVFYPTGDGDYTIWAVGTKARYFDIEEAKNENGAILEATETPYGEGTHNWKLVNKGENVYALMSKISDYTRCVDVEGVSKDEGHHIHLWEGGDSDNQKWEFFLAADGNPE